MAKVFGHAPTPNRLIIMVKEPRMGRVKTRLAREVGAVQAARFYRTTTAVLIRRLSCDPRWKTILAVAPDAAIDAAAWPISIPRVAQGYGDIGQRMVRALTSAKAAHTVLIGSDIPGVTAEHIAAAFRLLTRNDVVLGPAYDGGFWLIGVRRVRTDNLFAGVRWSSSHTLTDTLANLIGQRVGIAARLADVDDAASLRAATTTVPGRLSLTSAR